VILRQRGSHISSKTLPSADRAAGILRMAAMSLGRTETALGALYRRLAYRVGKAKAITATALSEVGPVLPAETELTRPTPLCCSWTSRPRLGAPLRSPLSHTHLLSGLG